MADSFAPTSSPDEIAMALGGAPMAPRMQARPMVAPPMYRPQPLQTPAPMQAPIPQNFMDMVLQALSGAGPGFMAQAQERTDTGLRAADEAIARMRANNANTQQRLGGPMDPLELFGGPKRKPAAPTGAPSALDIVTANNSRTPPRPT